MLLGLLTHSLWPWVLLPLVFYHLYDLTLWVCFFGDILSVNNLDILIIWLGGAIILITLKIIWKPLLHQL